MPIEEIKKGLNIYLYYYTIPVFIILFFINLYSPVIKITSLNMNLMISIVSFLFGFLITITFSMLLTKTSALKDALAVETGRLVALYNLSKKLGKDFHERIKKRIDDYTRITLKNYMTYELSRDSFYGIYEDTDFAEVKTKQQEIAFNSFLYILGEFAPLREKLEYLTNRRIEWSIKFADYSLGIILIILLFLNRGEPFTNGLFVILSTIIIFIFFIIEDFDDLRIGDYTYNISNSEQIFDMLGNERYYPYEVLNRVELTPGVNYRIGIYDKKLKEEKIVKIQYTPSFSRILKLIAGSFRKKN